MSESSNTRKLGTALVIFCLCDLLISDTVALSRQKRGFRQDAATRVAHGFGKRASFLPYGQLDNLSSFLEDTNDGSEILVHKFERLLAKHPSLTRFLLQNYLSNDGEDDLASSEDFSNRAMRQK